jgi:hypothetical protein
MLYNNPHEPYTQASCNLRTVMMISKYSGHLAGAVYLEYPKLSFLFDSILDDPNNRKCHLVSENMTTPFLRYLTGRFICDRGVSHELVRHRMCSFAQESTRYCNYKSGVQFIIPSWFEQYGDKQDVPHEYLLWIDTMDECETNYKQSLSDGQTPQQARSVLPNSLKTEIIVQARLSEWKHIFEQRCSKTAHPDMQELMIPFQREVTYSDINISNYLNS